MERQPWQISCIVAVERPAYMRCPSSLNVLTSRKRVESRSGRYISSGSDQTSDRLRAGLQALTWADRRRARVVSVWEEKLEALEPGTLKLAVSVRSNVLRVCPRLEIFLIMVALAQDKGRWSR